MLWFTHRNKINFHETLNLSWRYLFRRVAELVFKTKCTSFKKVMHTICLSNPQYKSQNACSFQWYFWTYFWEYLRCKSVYETMTVVSLPALLFSVAYCWIVFQWIYLFNISTKNLYFATCYIFLASSQMFILAAPPKIFSLLLSQKAYSKPTPV